MSTDEPNSVSLRIAVIDDDGNVCAPGIPGDIAVHARDVHGQRDPIFFLGYWNNERATHAKFTGAPFESRTVTLAVPPAPFGVTIIDEVGAYGAPGPGATNVTIALVEMEPIIAVTVCTPLAAEAYIAVKRPPGPVVPLEGARR